MFLTTSQLTHVSAVISSSPEAADTPEPLSRQRSVGQSTLREIDGARTQSKAAGKTGPSLNKRNIIPRAPPLPTAPTSKASNLRREPAEFIPESPSPSFSTEPDLPEPSSEVEAQQDSPCPPKKKIVLQHRTAHKRTVWTVGSVITTSVGGNLQNLTHLMLVMKLSPLVEA